MSNELVTPTGQPARRAIITQPLRCPRCGDKLTPTFGGGGVCLKPQCEGYTTEKEEADG